MASCTLLRSLSSDKLSLLSAKASFPQKVPSLNFSRECHIVVGQLVVEMVMLSGVLQKALAMSSMEP